MKKARRLAARIGFDRSEKPALSHRNRSLKDAEVPGQGIVDLFHRVVGDGEGICITWHIIELFCCILTLVLLFLILLAILRSTPGWIWVLLLLSLGIVVVIVLLLSPLF